MTGRSASSSTHSKSLGSIRLLTRSTAAARRAGEFILFALVAGSPWLLAGAEPAFEFVITAGVALLLAVWALHTSLVGRLTLKFDALTLPLAGLAFYATIQLVPLPESVVGVVSPQRLAWHRDLIPAEHELLFGETGPTVPRSTWLPLTVSPGPTWLFLARVSGLLLLGLAVRNWLATRETLDRLAWVLTVNGGLLAFLSLGAFFGGSPDRVMWIYPTTAGSAYGPFVCRNHYPDYAAIALGFALGLLIKRNEGRPITLSEAWVTPERLGLLSAISLMAVAVPFSLSRGGALSVVGAGVLAWLLTRVPNADDRTERSPARFLLGAALAVGFIVFLWLGTGAVERRFETLKDSGGLSSRIPLWRDALKLVPAAWATGTGAGTFATVEPTVRSEGATVFYENAHNDYLEALIEGGVVRLALTLILAFGVVGSVARGYLIRRNRSVGPRLLGLFFALAAVAMHAGGDFALHLPAVAVAAIVAAAFALAAASDERFVPARAVKRRSQAENPPAESSPTPVAPPTFTGPVAALITCGLAVAAGGVALESRQVARVERLRGVADHQPVGSLERADTLAAAAALRPADAIIQYDAGQAYLDAAVAKTPASDARFPASVIAGPVRQAAKHFFRARAADPLLARVHGRLGVLAPYFARGDSAKTYLDRAKRLQPADPETWFAAGREALGRSDLRQVFADWRRAAALSESHQERALKALAGVAPPARIRDKLVPANPERLLAATQVLFPDPGSPGRRETLNQVVTMAQARGDAATADDRIAQARAEAELGRPEAAEAAWRSALELAPDRADVHDRFAQWLDAQERYAEEVEQLEWLRRGRPNAYQQRYDAARHGAELIRILSGP